MFKCSQIQKYTLWEIEKKSKNNLWMSSGKENFKCKWLKSTYVSFTRFKFFMLNGHLVDNDLNIQQDITATKCVYNFRFCCFDIIF